MHMLDKHMDRHGDHVLAIGPQSKCGTHKFSLYCTDCKTKKNPKPLFLDWLKQSDAQALDKLGIKLLGEYNV
jgi:hypothetical protein